MNMPAWKLKGSQAELEIAGLRGTLNTADPIAGLTFIHAGGAERSGARWDDLRVFALDRPALQAVQQRPAPPECRLRGNDLVAVYRESSAWPVQLDVVWRAAFPLHDKRILAALDVMLSIHTSLLDSHPQLIAVTTVPTSPTLRLIDAAAASWQSLDVAAGRGQLLEPSNGCGCVVVRVPNAPWSYAEMIHPADFRSDRWTACGPDSAELHHGLFPQTLEKGVLVRARMRGAWVTRDNDLEAAAACYAAFAAGEPPLGNYGPA